MYATVCVCVCVAVQNWSANLSAHTTHSTAYSLQFYFSSSSSSFSLHWGMGLCCFLCLIRGAAQCDDDSISFKRICFQAIYGLCFHHWNLIGSFCLNVLRTMIRIFVSAHGLNTFSSCVMCFIMFLEVQWIGRVIVIGARTHINLILNFLFGNRLWIGFLF